MDGQDIVQVHRITLTNFRGIKTGEILLDGHTLLVGGNSVGKSTICEALDLVLGPERMFRRPVVDEYDFFSADYLNDDEVVEIRIETVLIELSEAALRRFGGHLRKWDRTKNDFADVDPGAVDEEDEHEWSLPVAFFGRFNPAEDDFEGGTYFMSPEPVVDDLALEDTELGGGRAPFTREDKRHCGYLYLRPNRTGTRALSLQRGSLLDTIIRLESETEITLWEKLRGDLAGVDLSEEGSELAGILDGVENRISNFMSLGLPEENVRIYASDLTRENIREVLRVFISSQPGTFPVPLSRLSTGSLNLLVFALLTYIAELKGDSSVIFAIEEPEIALPPHAQRRLVDFATSRMGQAIVTSHSPYVLERFAPENILVLQRDAAGSLTGGPVSLPTDFKLKRYRENRRQFAEAVLARGVLVVEGATEASLIPVVADVIERDGAVDYTHLDLAGVSVFNAGNDVSVPLYAPLFKSLGKPSYGMHDTPNQPLSADLTAKASDFTIYRVIPYSGIEDLLVSEMPQGVKRRFLDKAAARDDYPVDCGVIANGTSDAEVDVLLKKVLKARKGAYAGYAADLVAEAGSAAELPSFLVTLLLDINQDLGGPTGVPAVEAEAEAEGPGPEAAGETETTAALPGA
jgi:putative ATP-dependent endonuclease of the OLD family